MKGLHIIPYPEYMIHKEGTTCAALFTRAEEPQEGPLKTGILSIGREGKTEVVFLPPQEGLYEAYVYDEEGYAIQIEEGKVCIYASTPAGYLYGALTLGQLVKQFPEQIPCMEIADRPKWRHRGAQVCYAQINVAYREAWLRKFIPELAAMKINTLYLYMEWRFWFEGIAATHNKHYLTPQAVKEIEAICKAYHITVVPAINVMGHTGDFLGMEAFQEIKEYDMDKETLLSAPASALCPNHPKTRLLIAQALDNLMDAFESPIIHVGGDEVEKIGVCPRCRPIKDAKGAAAIYVDYFSWIRDRLQNRGRKMGIWGDMIEHYLTDQADFEVLRYNTLIYNWSYDGPAREKLIALKKAGFEVICSTSTHTCSVGTLWPGQVRNQQSYFKDGFELGCLGGVVTDWINGWSMHAEHAGLNYAMAAALMWQGTDETFAEGTSQGESEAAYLFQKYGEAADAMAALIHLQGDPKSELLRHFPGQKNGSYLRKAAYLSTNPMQVYMHFNQCLEGEKLIQYRQAVEKLEKLWAQIEAQAHADQWLYFQRQGVVLHRYLLERYTAIEALVVPYREAACKQWTDQVAFEANLTQCVASLKSHEEMFEAPYTFVCQCHEKLGLEKGSILRIEKSKENYQMLYAFIEQLKDGHRPMPSLANIAHWLFEPPTTGFWEARNDEWYAEREPFRRVDIDGKIEWGSARW
ncbi:MAG: family 20 glycosylhydrolase [Cellulosilyticaceae bacterium]